MKSANQLKVFLVSNSGSFTRYEDHEAAIFIQLHELIEDAIEEMENPIALIEENLSAAYNLGSSVNEIASYLFQSGEMMSALNVLKENWQAFDENLPEDSLMYGNGISKEEVVEIYSEKSLRTFLEALVAISNEYE